MMITRLVNINNIEITVQQASMLDVYSKRYEEDNVVKKEEFFRDQEFNFVLYHKQPSEEISNILSEFEGVELVIRETSFSGTKRYEQNTEYNASGAVEDKYNYVYDENNDLIASEKIDLSTGLPVYEETLKYYFDRNLDPENELFDCTYTEDGELDRIIYNPYSDQDSQWFWADGVAGESDIETLRGLTGLTETEMDYYLTATLNP